MSQKKYLIYVDILGFEELAKEIARKKDIEERSVRKNFINTIKNKLEELKEENISMTIVPGSDDWIIVVDSRDKVFSAISKILDHYTNYRDYPKIPLEIAIGTVKYDKWARLNGNELIYENGTIEYLKSNIIEKYEEWYKEINKDSIEVTFVISTESFFYELPISDQEKCHPIHYEKGYFYNLPESLIKREIKITEFLEKIKQKKSDFSGSLIDRIFIPPEGYDEIRDTLERDRIVFITGTAGYGKTYTAISLLWEYFNKNYIPHWIPGKNKVERNIVKEELSNIDRILEPRHIIYFEDPFGKTQYEGRDDLKERINHIISAVKNSEDTYVIITSRKDVFEEFEYESYSVEELTEFEKELNILQPSYNPNKKREILEKWAIEKGCKWIDDEKLREAVFKSIEIENNLPTPLNIYDFVESTINTRDLDELIRKIYEYSKITPKAFADEIWGLYNSDHKDRVLFLSLIFILEADDVDFVYDQYNELKKEDYQEFEDILEKEYRVKKGAFDDKYFDSDDYLTFSHSSYSESIKYAIKYPGIKKIFSDVLTHLFEIKTESIISKVSWAIVMCYNDLPDNVKKLIFYLSENFDPEDDIDIGDIAEAIAYYYDNIPQEVRKLLFTFAEQDPRRIALSIDKYFDMLPEDVRNALLVHIFDCGGEEMVVVILSRYLNKIPEDIRNLLLIQASKNKDVSRALASAIATNYAELPENIRNLLVNLSKDDYTAGYAAEAITNNYEKLPAEIRLLLNKYSEEKIIAGYVAVAVAKNYDKIPEELRKKLLLKDTYPYFALSTIPRILAPKIRELPTDIKKRYFAK